MSTRDMYGLPVRTVLCRACALLYASPRPTEDALASFYDGEYRRLDRPDAQAYDAFFELQRTKGERILAFLGASGVQPEQDGLVVDVGCGAGGVLAPFRAQGFEVLGVDPGSEYVEYGTRVHGIDLHRGDLREALRLAAERGRRIGLIIFEQVLEHLPQPVQELARARGALPENGLLFVGVPGLRNVRRHYGGDFLHYLQFPHLSYFELATLERVARRAGLGLVHGDETIQALFRSDGLHGKPLVSPSPDDVITYLRRLERGYRTRRVRAHVLSRVRRLRGAVARRIR
ncbi:MAG: class I SAM-dependent methyltransferase [Gaiellaceae bacterium]